MDQHENNTVIAANVQDYLQSRPIVTLATASPSGVPRATTLMYASDEAAIYIWIRPDTVTAQHITANPTLAITIDNYSDDWTKIKGVQASVQAEPIRDPGSIDRAIELFKMKFPDLTVQDTTNLAFFRLVPQQLHFIDNEAAADGGATKTLGQSFHRNLIYSVFRDLPPARVDEIVGTLETTTVAEGTVIVREGDPADNFFIIIDGEVEVLRDGGGPSSEITTQGPGQFFGEVAVLRDIPRTATVRATKPTTLLTMDRDTFRSLVAQSLSTTADLHEIIRQRLERA